MMSNLLLKFIRWWQSCKRIQGELWVPFASCFCLGGNVTLSDYVEWNVTSQTLVFHCFVFFFNYVEGIYQLRKCDDKQVFRSEKTDNTMSSVCLKRHFWGRFARQLDLSSPKSHKSTWKAVILKHFQLVEVWPEQAVSFIEMETGAKFRV